MEERINDDLRRLAKDKGVKMWQIAIELNISEMTLTRLFRTVINDKKRAAIITAIDAIAARTH